LAQSNQSVPIIRRIGAKGTNSLSLNAQMSLEPVKNFEVFLGVVSDSQNFEQVLERMKSFPTDSIGGSLGVK